MLVEVKGFAQNRQSFSHLSVNNGLSQSTVYSITQDSKGFMWFGTGEGGLNKYNGYEFQIFRRNPEHFGSLSSNEIRSILEDSRGRLWIGTANGGLNLFNKDTEVFRTYTPKTSNKLNPSNLSVLCIHEDRSNNIWLGTSNGVYMYNEADDCIVPKLTDASIPLKGVTGICEDLEGNLYLVTLDRLIRYDLELDQYQELVFSQDPFEISGGRINPILLDSQSRLWIGTAEGIKIVDIAKGFVFDIQAFAEVKWPAAFKTVRSILESREGILWFGTGNGLYALDPEQGKLKEYKTNPANSQSLINNSVISIFEDQVGTLWIGTWSGISVLDKRKNRFELYQHHHNDPQSLSSNFVSSFQETYSGTWIGTEEGGLNLMHKDRTIYDSFKHRESDPGSLPSNNVKAVFADSNKDLWVGTYKGGLSVYEGNGRFLNFMADNSVYSMAEMSGGKLYVGSRNGLFMMDLSTREISDLVFPVSSGKQKLESCIRLLYTDSKQRLWIGTIDEGACLLDHARESVEWFTVDDNDSTNLNVNNIYSFCEDNDQNIWIGTTNGLFLFQEESRSFKRISFESGLENCIINGLLVDSEGSLWIATNRGIFRYNPLTKDVLQYNFLDGLQSNEFTRGAYFQNSKGELFFGGVYGFNVFRPEEIYINPDPPPVVISDFKLFNKSVVPGEENSPLKQHISETEKITLSYKQFSFSIEFVALNYLNPEKNSYKYKLEGYEDEWNFSANSRTVSYMNLKPGSYTFRVKGSNNDMVWNPQDTSLDIEVKSPPWSTPFAFVIYFCILTSFLIILVKTVRYRVTKENELIQERAEKDNLRELNKMRLQFFTNISHEFRTPLTLIASPLDKISSGNYVYQQEYLISLMKSNVNRMLRLVNQLMDFRKLENEKMPLKVSKGNIEEFLSQIVHGFEDLANGKMIELRYDVSMDVPNGTEQWFDEGVIDKVIYNLLSNANKFTPEKGTIEVSLHVDENFARLRVKDTGKGIDQEKIKRIFERYFSESHEFYAGTGIGLSLSKRLIDLHRGTISVSSDKGANFLVSIPVSRSAFTEEEIISKKKELFFNHSVLNSNNMNLSITGPIGINEKSGIVILIAEDNPELSHYLSDLFQDYKSILTCNGKEALKKARKVMPNLVLTDVMMPEMDGLELCRQLKGDFLTSHIPVVMLTAKVAVDEKIQGVSNGADAYVEKPFDAEYLKSIVKNLLKQREQLRQKFSGLTPSENTHEEHTGTDQLFMKKMNGIVKAKLADPSFGLDQLQKEIGMSRSQLYRKFKMISDKSPSEYIRILRLQHSLELLKAKRYSVYEVSDMSGFTNETHFITCFKRHFGKPPGKYLTNNS
jgi:ligand-binding sensor domain-containing protein/signal transduction histidine kinase/AraC-like DNA-binding protein